MSELLSVVKELIYKAALWDGNGTEAKIERSVKHYVNIFNDYGIPLDADEIINELKNK